MNIIDYISQNRESFTKSEKMISDYLLKNRNNITNLSAKDLALRTKTSPPTVVRFAKKIGFNSLNEMKLSLLVNNIHEKSNKSQFEYLENDLSTKNIIYGIKESIDKTMKNIVEILDEKNLEKAIEVLSKANNIYIFGVGASGIVGQDLYFKLGRINKRCTSYIDTHFQIASSTLLEKEDAVLAISYSGDTREILECVKNAKERKATVICLTKKSINNSLAKLSDIILEVPFVEKSFREGAMNSRIACLAVIDMLYIGISRNNSEYVKEKLIETRKAVKRKF